MAKFRHNHKKGNNKGMGTKMTLFMAIISGIFLLFQTFGGGSKSNNQHHNNNNNNNNQQNHNKPKTDTAPGHTTKEFEETGGYLKEYFPTGATGQMVHHQFYSLNYNEEHEQANWVAYELTKERLDAKWAKRPNDFRPDKKVKTGSADRYDYKHSGYDRGHMVPAADMAFSKGAINQTFYFSNMTPQVRKFNQGIWRELEEQTRDWAKKFRHLYIVTGPILTQQNLGAIGKNEVTIPGAYYKIILDLSEPEIKGIGFIMPNAVTDRHIHDFAVSIDEVEAVTGYDFFPKLEDQQEYEIEKKINTKAWNIDQKRFKNRVAKWNK